jgi:hypothetical protein
MKKIVLPVVAGLIAVGALNVPLATTTFADAKAPKKDMCADISDAKKKADCVKKQNAKMKDKMKEVPKKPMKKPS